MVIKVKKLISFILAVCMMSVALASCSPFRKNTDTGVGRSTESNLPVQTQDTSDTETDGTPAVSDTDALNTTPTGVIYNNPDLTVTGSITVPSDLSFLDGINKGHFADKNADDPKGCWWPGRISRDLTTGEITVKYDRAQETIDLINKYGAIYCGNSEEKIVYLTFDCGYEYTDAEHPNGVTSSIIDTLKTKNVTGTFFVTGDYIRERPDVIKRMLDEGHIVGTHTMHHYNMTTVTPEVFVEEIKSNNDLLKEKIPGAPDMVFYRPPEGGSCEWNLALAQQMGLCSVFWSATEADYNTDNQPDPAQTLINDKQWLHNGCVYLLHAVSTTNAQILGELIDYIRAEGYEIRSLADFKR